MTATAPTRRRRRAAPTAAPAHPAAARRPAGRARRSSPSPGRATRTSAPQRWLLAVVARSRVLVLVGSVVSYLVTGYHVVGRELRIYEGLLSRRTRAIPLERLQSVELVRPLLARLFGLAELRLEVVGAAKTEAPLAFLPRRRRPTRCGERLLGLARVGPARRPPASLGTPADGSWPVDAAAGSTAPPPVAAARAARARDQQPRPGRLAAAATAVVGRCPLAIAAPIIYFAFDGRAHASSPSPARSPPSSARSRRRCGRCSSTGASPLAAAADGLRLRRGLLETRSQTVPPGRIQAVGVQWPLLWRGHGWVRVAHADRRCLRRRTRRAAAGRAAAGRHGARRRAGHRRGAARLRAHRASPCTRCRDGPGGWRRCAAGSWATSSRRRPSSPATAC